MPEGTITIDIERSLEEVFEFVANLENAPQWVPDLVSVEKATDGEIGIGTQYNEIVQMGNNQGTATLVITEYDPPNSIAHEGEGGPSRFFARFSCTASGNGTVLQHDYSVTMTGMAKLLTPMVAGWVKKNSVTAMNQLKEILES